MDLASRHSTDDETQRLPDTQIVPLKEPRSVVGESKRRESLALPSSSTSSLSPPASHLPQYPVQDTRTDPLSSLSTLWELFLRSMQRCTPQQVQLPTIIDVPPSDVSSPLSAKPTSASPVHSVRLGLSGEKIDEPQANRLHAPPAARRASLFNRHDLDSPCGPHFEAKNSSDTLSNNTPNAQSSIPHPPLHRAHRKKAKTRRSMEVVASPCPPLPAPGNVSVLQIPSVKLPTSDRTLNRLGGDIRKRRFELFFRLRDWGKADQHTVQPPTTTPLAPSEWDAQPSMQSTSSTPTLPPKSSSILQAVGSSVGPTSSHEDSAPPVVLLEPQSGSNPFALDTDSSGLAGSQVHQLTVDHPATHGTTVDQQGPSDKALGKRRERLESLHDLTSSKLENVHETSVDKVRKEFVGIGDNSPASASSGTPLGQTRTSPSIVGTALDVEVRNCHSSEEYDELPFNVQRLMQEHPVQDLSGQVTVDKSQRPIEGGHALVYTGTWKGERVAVKIPVSRRIRQSNPNWETSGMKRFWREVGAAAAVSHPNISIFHGYSYGLAPFPAMIWTWCHHGTVIEYLDATKPPVLRRMKLALGLSEAVQYLHQLGLIHGDIKPSNVLVDDELVARLCDFGLARPIAGHMSDETPYMGTTRYMAKELFISPDNPHPRVTPEGDIYSLGCVLVEIVEHPIYTFGHVEAKAIPNAIFKKEPPALRSQSTRDLKDLTEIFWDLLGACWAPAADRPAIQEVVRDLGSIESSCVG